MNHYNTVLVNIRINGGNVVMRNQIKFWLFLGFFSISNGIFADVTTMLYLKNGSPKGLSNLDRDWSQNPIQDDKLKTWSFDNDYYKEIDGGDEYRVPINFGS